MREHQMGRYKLRPPRTQDRDVQTMDIKNIRVKYKDSLLANIFTRNVEALPGKIAVAQSISAYEEEAVPERISLLSLIPVPEMASASSLLPIPDAGEIFTRLYNDLTSDEYRYEYRPPSLPATPPKSPLIEPRQGSVTPVQIHTPPSSPQPPIHVPSPIPIYTPKPSREPTPESTPPPSRASSKTSTKSLPQASEDQRAHPSFVNQFPVEAASRAVVESSLFVPRFLF